MNKLLAILIILSASCYKTELSSELREPGEIIQLGFIPGTTASGTGITSSGKLVITSTTIPDRYIVVISCMHGRFSLNAESEQTKNIWKKFKEKDSITIYYKEVYHIQDNIKTLYDLDFIDATPKIPFTRNER